MKILEFKTLNTSIFRTLFETLKEILTDINIHFTSEGLYIKTTDSSKSIIISLDLEAENFEYYHCEREDFNIGINSMNFNKIIKTCPLTSVLHFYYDDEEEGKLFIIMEDEEKNIRSEYQLNLIETNESHINLKNLEYKMVSYLPCTLFQKNIKDIKNFAEEIEITYKNDELSILYDSGFVQSKITMGNTTEEAGLKIQTKSPTEITGKYSLESISKIIKCSNLCEQVNLSFIQRYEDFFLSLIYETGNLGKIQFILLKKNNEE